MANLNQRTEAWKAIRDDYEAMWPPGEMDGLPHDPRLASLAEKARSVLEEPFEHEDIYDLILDALNDFDANGSPDYLTTHAIEFRLRGKLDYVVHEAGTSSGEHRITVNGVAGDWFPADAPAWNGTICTARDRSGKTRIFRTIEMDLATVGRVG